SVDPGRVSNGRGPEPGPDRMATPVRPGAQIPDSDGSVYRAEIGRPWGTTVHAFCTAAELVGVVDDLRRRFILRSRTYWCISQADARGGRSLEKGKGARGQRHLV